MNMAPGHLESSNGRIDAVFGPHRVAVAPAALQRHPGIEGFMNQEIVIGFRPGDSEHASLGGEGDRTMEVEVDVVEVLGSETFVHYPVSVPPVPTPDAEELLAESGTDASSLGSENRFASRISGDIAVRTGDTVRLTLETAKMHFFDPVSGDRIGFSQGNMPR